MNDDVTPDLNNDEFFDKLKTQLDIELKDITVSDALIAKTMSRIHEQEQVQDQIVQETPLQSQADTAMNKKQDNNEATQTPINQIQHQKVTTISEAAQKASNNHRRTFRSFVRVASGIAAACLVVYLGAQVTQHSKKESTSSKSDTAANQMYDTSESMESVESESPMNQAGGTMNGFTTSQELESADMAAGDSLKTESSAMDKNAMSDDKPLPTQAPQLMVQENISYGTLENTVKRDETGVENTSYDSALEDARSECNTESKIVVLNETQDNENIEAVRKVIEEKNLSESDQLISGIWSYCILIEKENGEADSYKFYEKAFSITNYLNDKVQYTRTYKDESVSGILEQILTILK